MKFDWRSIVRGLLRSAITLGFLVAGLTKFSPQSAWAERFAGWGYPAWLMTMVGALEVAGAVAIWVPRFSRHSVGLLAALMLGAIYTNATHSPRSEVLRPAAFLVALAALAWLQPPASGAPEQRTGSTYPRNAPPDQM